MRLVRNGATGSRCAVFPVGTRNGSAKSPVLASEIAMFRASTCDSRIWTYLHGDKVKAPTRTVAPIITMRRKRRHTGVRSTHGANLTATEFPGQFLSLLSGIPILTSPSTDNIRPPPSAYKAPTRFLSEEGNTSNT